MERSTKSDDGLTPRGGHNRARRQHINFWRIWLPAALCLFGVVILIADGFDLFGVSAFAAFVGAGLSVALTNVLWRIGIAGNSDRDDEEDARRYLAQHGHWPGEGTLSGVSEATETTDPTPETAPPDAAQRLLTAWRGEIIAGKSYELIAERLAPREADILRRMAAAEANHRSRLEARMTELGVAIPDPANVRVSTWQRLQAKLAPVDRLLAAREAAEDDEVGDLYKRSTGDPATDTLLRDIRKEERAHSYAVSEIRRDGEVAEEAVPDPTLTYVQQAAKARLDKITGREKWHTSGGGWVSGVIYGANDGLASVFGLVAGVSGATGGSRVVLTAGVAGAIAAALSMATGAFLASRSEQEIAHANVQREREEIAEHPEEEREELSLFYQLKGVEPEIADQMAEQMSRNPDAMLQALAQEEFGGMGEDDEAAGAALAAGVSTGIGALLPVIPFFFMTGTGAIVLAAVISLAGHFAVGAAKSLITLRTWWSAGLEMTFAGVLVGGVTFLVGLALPT